MLGNPRTVVHAWVVVLGRLRFPRVLDPSLAKVRTSAPLSVSKPRPLLWMLPSYLHECGM